MLESYNLSVKMEKEAYKSCLGTMQKQFTFLQQQAKQLKIPVVLLFEGWGASGKGILISKLIESLDPRWFKVYTIGEATTEEIRFPFLYRYWKKIPEQGQMAIFDRSWYRDVSISRVEDCLSNVEIEKRFGEILEFEHQLTEDGYLLVKFFLHMSKKEQKRRFEALDSRKATAWRVTDADWKHNKNYDLYQYAFEDMITRTDKIDAPWTVIEAHDRRHATIKMYTTVTNAMEKAIAAKEKAEALPETSIRISPKIASLPISSIKEIDLSVTLEPEQYSSELKRCQKRLFELHNQLYKKKIPLIIVYEGWDAAGKGGNIKRITEGLDPRGYEVIPIAAPTPAELHRHYLWRFWNSLPKDGHIAIYDRSWYGRVMVERIEGFCKEEEWHRAYDEINHFEKSLQNWGAIIIKFWLHISKEEQLARFTERQNTPEKQWKITEDDWRNRNRWEDYETAVDEMLHFTNTAAAPWVIVESNDKEYARIKVLHEVIARIEKKL